MTKRDTIMYQTSGQGLSGVCLTLMYRKHMDKGYGLSFQNYRGTGGLENVGE